MHKLKIELEWLTDGAGVNMHVTHEAPGVKSMRWDSHHTRLSVEDGSFVPLGAVKMGLPMICEDCPAFYNA